MWEVYYRLPDNVSKREIILDGWAVVIFQEIHHNRAKDYFWVYKHIFCNGKLVNGKWRCVSCKQTVPYYLREYLMEQFNATNNELPLPF